MIYLTGDVHAQILGHWEQDIASELDSSFEYLEILKKYGVSCTLFVNGISLDENWNEYRRLLDYDIELGGHTYDNFGKMNMFKSYFNRRFHGCVYGKYRFQIMDVWRTKRAFERVGLKMKSWRTHAFASNNNTFNILARNGVRFVSDLLGDIKPFEKNGLVHMPINVPVDILVIEYGVLKPENRDPFASCARSRIKAEEWFEIIKKRVIFNEKYGVDSILLLHPISMKVLDDFKLFEEIVVFLSKFETRRIEEYA